MQRNDMAEKKKILIDGVELPGLVNFQEITLEKGQIDVPEFKKIRKIQSGITTIPAVELTYKTARDTNTLQFLKNWYFDDEVHDVVVVRTDASGAEFARTLLPSCECVRYQEPAFDAASPTYAQCPVTVLPWDVIPIEAE